jgi:protein SCO1/2
MTRSPSGRTRSAAVLAVVMSVVALGLAACGSDDGDDAGASGDGASDAGWSGAVLTEPSPRPDFTLTDTAGEPFSFREETAGQLTLLFFGYTNCPDICPLQMATLTQALEREGMPDPTVVFVSTDPQRDTPDELRSWLDAFDPDYVGLTGTLEEVHAAEELVGLQSSFLTDSEGLPVEEAPPEDGYEVAHSSQMVAYTDDDLAHIVYPAGVRRDDWQADLPRLAAGETPEPT